MNQENRSIFNEDYSKSYDLIYEKKNYNDECNRIIKFINYKKSVSNILDLGCGTCSHSIILSKYGFNIDAIDRSGKMLEIAKNKIRKKNISNIKLIQADIENLDLNNAQYDVILLLFNVLGYLKKPYLFFSNLKKYLKKGSLVIFDFWHESAIIQNGPKKIKKNFKKAEVTLTKISQGKVNQKDKTIIINIQTYEKEENAVIAKNEEEHHIKYYNIEALSLNLINEGFKVLKFEDFENDGCLPSKENWSAYCVSKYLG